MQWSWFEENEYLVWNTLRSIMFYKLLQNVPLKYFLREITELNLNEFMSVLTPKKFYHAILIFT